MLSFVRNRVTPFRKLVTQVCFFKDGNIHREETGITGGPAIQRSNGTNMWVRNGKWHRYGGPAIEWADGDQEWFVDGKRHRAPFQGPSVITYAGSKFWYSYNQLHRTDGPAIEWSNGDREWYVNGLRHRVDGPAIECVNGYKEWRVEGKLTSISSRSVPFGVQDFTVFVWTNFLGSVLVIGTNRVTFAKAKVNLPIVDDVLIHCEKVGRGPRDVDL